MDFPEVKARVQSLAFTEETNLYVGPREKMALKIALTMATQLELYIELARTTNEISSILKDGV